MPDMNSEAMETAHLVKFYSSRPGRTVDLRPFFSD